MMNAIDFLDEKLEEAKNIFARSNLYRYILIPDFDCSFLPVSSTNGKYLPEDIKASFFSYLHQYDNTEGYINDFPCIYAIEMVNETDKERVVQAFMAKRQKIFDRTLPAFKERIPDSRYLYVGKVQREVGGRLVTHLGYYQSAGNHGLQLAFWARALNPSLRINVHVFRFEKDMAPFMGAFEKILAVQLKPLVGKHK